MDKKQLILAVLSVWYILTMNNSYLYAQTDEEIQNHVIVGCRFLINEKIDQAIAEFNTAIGLMKPNKPECYLAYYNRARAYERKGLLDEAFADYTTAIKLNPRYLLAYYGRAYVLQKKGEFINAIREYNRILEIDNYQPHAYNNRGICYYEINEFSDAMSDYNKALELDSGLLNAHYNRGIAKINNGEYYEAAFDFEKELELFPRSMRPKYYLLAVSAFNNKKYYDSWIAVRKLTALKVIVSSNFLEDLKKASGRKSPPEIGETQKKKDIIMRSN